MTKSDFISLLKKCLDETGMSEGCYNDAYLYVGDEENINTAIYIDRENNIWITDDESVKRIKTSINVDDVVEIRYSRFGSCAPQFFVICRDYSGLDFCDGKIGYFTDGFYGAFKKASEFFTENPVI